MAGNFVTTLYLIAIQLFTVVGYVLFIVLAVLGIRCMLKYLREKR